TCRAGAPLRRPRGRIADPRYAPVRSDLDHAVGMVGDPAGRERSEDAAAQRERRSVGEVHRRAILASAPGPSGPAKMAPMTESGEPHALLTDRGTSGDRTGWPAPRGAVSVP